MIVELNPYTKEEHTTFPESLLCFEMLLNYRI